MFTTIAAPPEDIAMIECSRVAYQYSSGQGITDVSASILQQSVYLLAGMNGSGKSTFLKVLAGGLKNYSGMIKLNGVDVYELRKKNRSILTVALSPQQPETQFSLPTVRDEMRFTAKAINKPVDTELESHILELLKLDSDLDDSPFDLPPMKRKLLSLAIAGVIPSPYIALDEPTAGIDPIHKPLVLQFIKFLVIHKGVIVVSHDIDTLLPIATHIGIMHKGTLVESTDKDTFLQNFVEGKYAAQTVRPFIIPRLARILIQKPAASVHELAVIMKKAINQK